MRILHLTAGSDAGGISRYLLDLCSAMRDLGQEVTIAGQRGAWHSEIETANLPWIDVPLKGGLLGFWKSARILRQHLAAHPVDVLHAHYRRAALLGRKLQHPRGTPPLLYTLHLSHIPLTWGRRWLSDFGDVTHVPAIAGQRWLLDQRLTTEDRIAYIPHGIDTDKFPVTTAAQRAAARAQLNLSPDNLVAAYVGRLDYPKNVEWLIDLARDSRYEIPSLRILIAGDGPRERSLRADVAARTLADRVIFLGHRDPLPIYQSADALLLPSLREGFALSAAEAMSTGIPVLRTRTSGTEEMIVQNVTGLSTAADPEAFIGVALHFLRDRARLQTMGRAAAAHIRDHLLFSRQLTDTISLYQRLAAGEIHRAAALPR